MGKKILIIDDASIMRNILKRVTFSLGYVCCGEASNGLDGIALYKEQKPDLVFCDLSMPKMNGMECLKGIMEFDPEAKVIICTSQGTEWGEEDSIKHGAKAFLAKPFMSEQVEKVVKKVMSEGEQSYKDMLYEQSVEMGLSQREILDFYDVFRTITGMDMDDLQVDEAYMKEKKDSIIVGAEAMLTAKMSLESVNKLVHIFDNMVEG